MAYTQTKANKRGTGATGPKHTTKRTRLEMRQDNQPSDGGGMHYIRPGSQNRKK